MRQCTLFIRLGVNIIFKLPGKAGSWQVCIADRCGQDVAEALLDGHDTQSQIRVLMSQM